MKNKLLKISIITPFLFSSVINANSLNQNVDLSQIKALSGDQANACGALLCLAGGVSSGACAPYIARYFSIKLSKPHKTVQARKEFLAMCPSASVDDKEFARWQSEIVPNVDGVCTKEELNRDEKSKNPIRIENQYDINGNIKKIEIYRYRINPTPTHSCNLLMQHNYFSKKISYTCSKEFYDERTWFNGYTKEEISKNTYDSLSENLRLKEQKRTQISYQEYLNLPNDEKIRDKNKYYKLEPIYFKKNFIKKDCWLVEDKVVMN